MNQFARNFMGAVASAVVTLGVFGGGAAAASGPDFSGQTYGKAAAQIKTWGQTPVIASVVGDQLATDNCFVTSSANASNLDSSGKSRGRQVLLHLNCNLPLAEPGKPGNSAASPEGAKSKIAMARLEYYGQDPEKRCAAAPKYCKELCDEFSDKCSSALQDYAAAVS